MSDERQDSNLFPILTLILLVALGVGGWWVFPKLQRMMSEQSCIASGQTNCGQPGAPH